MVLRLLTKFPVHPQRMSLFATSSSKHISVSVSKFALVDEKDKANNQTPKNNSPSAHNSKTPKLQSLHQLLFVNYTNSEPVQTLP